MLIQTDIPLTDEIDRLGGNARPIIITIPGEMRGKGRVKFSARGGFARAYTDAKTVTAENWVRSCASDVAPAAPLEGPVELHAVVGVAVPASWPKKRQAAALAGTLRPTSKPDIDNAVKLIADALNGVIWRDDKQIWFMVVRKVYQASPQTVLRVVGA